MRRRGAELTAAGIKPVRPERCRTAAASRNGGWKRPRRNQASPEAGSAGSRPRPVRRAGCDVINSRHKRALPRRRYRS